MADESAAETAHRSPLGTQEYWDEIYRRDRANFDDHGDAGEVWFGEDSVDKMVQWVVGKVEDKTARILDVGCGNGHLLFALAEEGYSNLVGVDYSADAVELSRTVAEAEGHESTSFSVMDVTDVSGIPAEMVGSFDLAVDKGTFDAITLAKSENTEKSPTARYQHTVLRLLKHDGLLLITSCNWTQDELVAEFEKHFAYHSHVKYPSFKFGGVQGQTIR
ncbi:S-adenosyl-L-methionine-dependent methyltransferase [Hyaloraphidium curvatum]|nr:S-adenosyl-L-methionine-dependent methyltransferase [Hyaloraphidium curvatum]